jgi:hypothetical protein
MKGDCEPVGNQPEHISDLHAVSKKVEEQTQAHQPSLALAVLASLDVLLEGLNRLGMAAVGFENVDQDSKVASRYLVLLFASQVALTADVELQSLLHGRYIQAGALDRLLAEEGCKCAFYATYPDDARRACATKFQREPAPAEMARKLSIRDYGRAFGTLSDFAHADALTRMQMWADKAADGTLRLNPWPHYDADLFGALAKDALRYLMITSNHIASVFPDELPPDDPWNTRLLDLERVALALLKAASA